MPVQRIETARRVLNAALTRHADGRSDEAIDLVRRSELAATAVGQNLIGDIEMKRGRPVEALAAFDTAVRISPEMPEAHSNRAAPLLALGRIADAADASTRAIELRPTYVAARLKRATAWLSLGDLARGFAEAEWRLQDPADAAHKIAPTVALWRGESLFRKRILVFAEQGIGDAIQFLRYLPLLRQRGAALIGVLVGVVLQRLTADSFPGSIDALSTIVGDVPFDYKVSLMSLAAIFGTTLATIPSAVPYLRTTPDRVEKWRQRIGEHGFRIGIVWQGNPRYGSDRERSMPVAHFAPIAAVPSVRLISLQAGPGTQQLRSLPAGMKVEELGEEISNNPDGLREVAAAMENLDLMVMSDTSPTHLAGALGRPVWVALPYSADWRWLRDREDSPWYPTMRLFRQETRGDWPGVFERIAREVAHVVESGGRAQASAGPADGPRYLPLTQD
jgi:hypothetical protein